MGGDGEALRHHGLKSFFCDERNQQHAKVLSLDLRVALWDRGIPLVVAIEEAP